MDAAGVHLQTGVLMLLLQLVQFYSTLAQIAFLITIVIHAKMLVVYGAQMANVELLEILVVA